MLVRLSFFILALALTACHRERPYDPEETAQAILRECRDDWACINERWRRNPRNWNLGLRAEVPGRNRKAPLVVSTTRELVTPELSGSPCAPGSGMVYFRTTVFPKTSGEFPTTIFHWQGARDAERGQRTVSEAVAAARGEREALWAAIRRSAELEAACVRFAGHRDRCEIDSSGEVGQ